MSRALGDFEFKDRPTLSAKEQKVTVDPDMTIIERTVGVQYPPGPVPLSRYGLMHFWSPSAPSRLL